MALRFLNGIHVSGETQLDFMPTHESEGILRLGRYDVNTSRYHDIKSYVSSTQASNYLKFSLHNGTTNTVADVLTLKGDLSSYFAGTVHIEHNSDNGATGWLTIEDTDDTSGSQNPHILFKGDNTQLGKIRVLDTSGMQFLTSDADDIALTLDMNQDATFTGHIIPTTDNAQDLGTTNSKDFRTLYVRNIDLYNNRLIVDASGTIARFSDHSTVGDGFQFMHLGTEILRLGNDTATSAVFAGTIAASNLSGTNTGDQTLPTDTLPFEFSDIFIEVTVLKNFVPVTVLLLGPLINSI